MALEKAYLFQVDDPGLPEECRTVTRKFELLDEMAIQESMILGEFDYWQDKHGNYHFFDGDTVQVIRFPKKKVNA